MSTLRTVAALACLGAAAWYALAVLRDFFNGTATTASSWIARAPARRQREPVSFWISTVLNCWPIAVFLFVALKLAGKL